MAEQAKQDDFIWNGRMIFIEEGTNEVKIRKLMIQYQDIQNFHEYISESFIDEGQTIVVNLYNGNQYILLESFTNMFNKFKKYRDKEAQLLKNNFLSNN